MDVHDTHEETAGEDRPSRTLSIAMIVVGILFLLPFIFVSLASGQFFSLSGFLSALFTVGWTFGLGVVFLLFGWKRLRGGDAPDEP